MFISSLGPAYLKNNFGKDKQVQAVFIRAVFNHDENGESFKYKKKQKKQKQQQKEKQNKNEQERE